MATRHSAVQCNFSQQVWKKLPFAVRMVGHAKVSDTVVSPHQKVVLPDEDEGRVHLILPVAFDQKGVIEQYASQNPDAIV